MAAASEAGARTFPSSAIWAALRECESGGDYGFVHPSGQYFGAYQFTVETWDRLAGQRAEELVGVLPAEAAPEDQDRLAHYLWFESSHFRWPGCSHVFSEEFAASLQDGTSSEAAESSAAGGDAGGSGSDGSEGSDSAGTEDGEQAATPPPAAEPDGTDDGEPDGSDTAGGNSDGGDAGSGESDSADTDTGDADGGESGNPTATTAPADNDPSDSEDDPADPPEDPSQVPAIPPDVEGFPTPEQWAALRFCESSGDYTKRSANGKFYGAYQFWPDTWDYVARRHYPRLVGVLPSQATSHDQDRMAYALYGDRGHAPWPVCGRHLR